MRLSPVVVPAAVMLADSISRALGPPGVSVIALVRGAGVISGPDADWSRWAWIMLAAGEAALALAMLLPGIRTRSAHVALWWIACVSVGSVFLPWLLELAPGCALLRGLPLATSVAWLALMLVFLQLIVQRRVGRTVARAGIALVIVGALGVAGCGVGADAPRDSDAVLMVETGDGLLVAVLADNLGVVPALNQRPAGILLRIDRSAVRTDVYGAALRALCAGTPVLDGEGVWVASVTDCIFGDPSSMVYAQPSAYVRKRFGELSGLVGDLSASTEQRTPLKTDLNIGQGVEMCCVWGDVVISYPALASFREGTRFLLEGDRGVAPVSALYGPGNCAYALVRAPPMALLEGPGRSARVARKSGPLIGAVITSRGQGSVADTALFPKALRVQLIIEQRNPTSSRQRSFHVAVRPERGFRVWFRQAVVALLLNADVAGDSADMSWEILGEPRGGSRLVKDEGTSLARAVAKAATEAVSSEPLRLAGQTLRLEVRQP